MGASAADLLARLEKSAAAAGLQVTREGNRVTGRLESIVSKWFLGGRKVTYRMSCQVDEAGGVVRFREATAESSWGVPPPSMTVEKTSTMGSRQSGTRTDKSPGGGGELDYAWVRESAEAAVRAAGWTFTFEAGRVP